MIRLFTSTFPSSPGARRDEYAEALKRNLGCAAIDAVMVMDEGSPDLPAVNEKLVVRRASQRPRFSDYFAWINEVAGDDDVSIVANSDIFFDNQLALFKRWKLPENTVIALSRWEQRDRHRSVLNDRNDSQDAWCFRGKVRAVDADFFVGVPRCDNRLISELRRVGYEVLNPSFALRAYHLHRGARDGYGDGHFPGYVPPPYEYVWPENLWPPHRVIAYNLRYPRESLGWRIDRRKWASRLKLHWFSKGRGILQGPAR